MSAEGIFWQRRSAELIRRAQYASARPVWVTARCTIRPSPAVISLYAVIGVLGGRHGDECLCLIRYAHSLLLRLLRNELCAPDETLTTVRLTVAHAVGVDREAVIEVCGPAYLAALQQAAQWATRTGACRGGGL